MPEAKQPPTVDGWPINVDNMDDGVRQIVGSAKRSDSFAVFTLNLDHLDKLRCSEAFRQAYGLARYVTADGTPVAMLASRGSRRIERTTGADLIVPLMRAAAAADLAVYLYGTSPHVLEKAGAFLAESTGSLLRITGAESPPHGFDPEGGEADVALDRIERSGARLCLVALGAPKQELFAARAVRRNIPVGFVCIGAGLDFLAGTQTRAPRFMQNSGLEWAWRLSTNPRRLALRYARCAWVLAQILIWPRRQQQHF